MFALLLIGAPGAGKSSVLEALSDRLVVDDVPHAMIETEALTSTHPPLADEQWLAHVRSACSLHRRQGCEVLLVAATVQSDLDLRALIAAIGGDAHAVVRLQAEPAALARRIIEREPEGWSGIDELVAATARLSPVLAGLDDVALSLSTDEQHPAVVAGHIRDAFVDVLRPASDRAGKSG